MVKVLDASALLVYLEKESGFEKVKDLFIKTSQDGKSLLVSSVNLGEVFYIVARAYDIEQAEKVVKLIESFPVEIVPVDWILAKQAAEYKFLKNLPYADCFAAALAKIYKGELVTKDSDFKVMDKEISISWL